MKIKVIFQTSLDEASGRVLTVYWHDDGELGILIREHHLNGTTDMMDKILSEEAAHRLRDALNEYYPRQTLDKNCKLLGVSSGRIYSSEPMFKEIGQEKLENKMYNKTDNVQPENSYNGFTTEELLDYLSTKNHVFVLGFLDALEFAAHKSERTRYGVAEDLRYTAKVLRKERLPR